MNIKEYTLEALEELSEKIRARILEVVSSNGGHLSSTLGATDIIVAMHKVFDPYKDPFIFDVSHQAYAHKLLTDRWDDFSTLRQFGGVDIQNLQNQMQTILLRDIVLLQFPWELALLKQLH